MHLSESAALVCDICTHRDSEDYEDHIEDQKTDIDPHQDLRELALLVLYAGYYHEYPGSDI